MKVAWPTQSQRRWSRPFRIKVCFARFLIYQIPMLYIYHISVVNNLWDKLLWFLWTCVTSTYHHATGGSGIYLFCRYVIVIRYNGSTCQVMLSEDRFKGNYNWKTYKSALQKRHMIVSYEREGASIPWQLDCSFIGLLRLTTKKTVDYLLKFELQHTARGI